MDPVSALVGVAIFLTGALLGLATGLVENRSARRRGQQGLPAEPVCGCRHHLSMHDRESGHCHAADKVLMLPRRGGSSYNELVSCGCRRYVGPENLMDVWVPPPAAGLPEPSGPARVGLDKAP